MRKIAAEFENIHSRPMKGIYKLVIGGKFYIGRAENLYARVYDHTYALNKELNRYPLTKQGQYNHWCQYLLENPSISTIKVIAVQRCERDSMLYFAEQFYLNQYFDNPDCLNLSKVASRTKCFFGTDDKIQIVTQSKRDELRWYYEDPEDMCSITYSDKELTCRGVPKKR